MVKRFLACIEIVFEFLFAEFRQDCDSGVLVGSRPTVIKYKNYKQEKGEFNKIKVRKGSAPDFS